MVAFGDMILFVLAAGFFGLAPTWYLLKLSIEKAPRALLAALFLIACLDVELAVSAQPGERGPPG